MERFDKFTDRARKVLTLAQDEANRLDHNYIGTEHVLLGLVREKDGVAARVLASMGVEQGKVRTAVESIIGRGERPVPPEVGLTPRAKRVIELAIDEARRLGHNYIGTEHLLLGLVREGEGIAAGVLESVGVNLDKVRHEVIRTLSMAGAIAHGSGGIAPPPAGRRYRRFEDWTADARAILVAAQGEAAGRAGGSIDTADLLLGAIAAPDSPASAVLAAAGVSPAQARAAVAEARAAGAAGPEDMPADGGLPGLTLAAKEALSLAEGQASRSLAEAVGVGDLLVALAMLPTTLAGRALAGLDLTTARIRDVIAEVVDDPPDEEPPAPDAPAPPQP